jgi:hypothetical protein
MEARRLHSKGEQRDECGRYTGRWPRARSAASSGCEPTSTVGAVAATTAVPSGAIESTEAAGFGPPAQETGGRDEWQRISRGLLRCLRTHSTSEGVRLSSACGLPPPVCVPTRDQH